MKKRSILVLLLNIHAVARADSTDPLLAVHSVDGLELARSAVRHGDAWLLERLAVNSDPAIAVLAAQAAPFTRAPEEMLVPLVRLAAGRDPDLAPLALRSAVEIARRLDPRDLDSREVSRATLNEVVAMLTSLSEDATARGDLRAAARYAREELRDVLAP